MSVSSEEEEDEDEEEDDEDIELAEIQKRLLIHPARKNRDAGVLVEDGAEKRDLENEKEKKVEQSKSEQGVEAAEGNYNLFICLKL